MEDATQSLDRTVIANGAEATVMGASVQCPVCSTENAAGEMYCGDCGFLLSSTPGEAAAQVETEDIPRLVDSTGREFLLRQGENSVGRESTDVLLADQTVSRRHALLVVADGKCLLEDLGSTNGTFVNGRPIQSGSHKEVSDGAELKFGSAVLTLRLPVGTESPEESVPEAEEAPETEPVSEVEIVEPVDEPVEEAATGPAPVARLVSVEDSAAEFHIVDGTNTIGRRSGNDIVMSDDPYVSGAHAELIADERGFWLVDVGSTNGTSLNGARITPDSRMALNSGDEIIFGRSKYRFEVM